MKMKLYWNGEITMSNGVGCGNDRMAELAKFRKKYFINSSVYRDLVSAAIKLHHKARDNIIFFTATFPFDPSEQEAQTIFTNFLKNLKKTYHANNYLWVKEMQKNGRIHYHFLCDIPYSNIKDMQKSYNSSISHIRPDICCSNNSLRLPNSRRFGNIVKDAHQVARYMGKYMAKSRYCEWNYPCYAISKNLFPLEIEIREEEVIFLRSHYENKLYTDNENYGKIILKNVILPKIFDEFPLLIDKIR